VPGDEFTQQLIPGLADDVFLHGRVWRHLRLPWGNGQINCVEYIYLLDTGVQASGSPDAPDPVYIRPYRYGVVVFGEGVGPISWREKWIRVGNVTQDLGGSPSMIFDVVLETKSSATLE
jgi:hypothetical protein